jgi:hypothetical protein
MPVPNTNRYDDIVGTGITLISTAKGAVFLIDTCDRHIAERYCWSLHESGYARAVTRTPDGLKTVYLHRLICQTFSDRPHVDHANGIEFDCRSENLRACTRSQNLRNQKLRADNTSGFKGVGLHKSTGLYRARVRGGARTHLGLFATAEEAASAAAAARASLHGEFARHG